MKACAPAPRPISCKNGTGAVFAKYYVVGLVYAPPGCTSTPGAPCSSQSSVVYGAQSALGTAVTVDTDTTHDVGGAADAKLDLGIGCSRWVGAVT